MPTNLKMHLIPWFLKVYMLVYMLLLSYLISFYLFLLSSLISFYLLLLLLSIIQVCLFIVQLRIGIITLNFVFTIKFNNNII